MADIVSFDVKLTPNQKLAQDKLNQVHQLYDEIEKLLGTQDVFKRPHLFMALPKKEPQTNEEWLRSCTKEQLAEFIADVCYGLLDDVWGNDGDTSCDYRETEKNYWTEWLKKQHEVK